MKPVYIVAALTAPLWAPAAIIAAAVLLDRKPAVAAATTDCEADRSARLFAAIDELAQAATDEILSTRPDVDRARIMRALTQGVTEAILDLAEIARGV